MYSIFRRTLILKRLLSRSPAIPVFALSMKIAQDGNVRSSSGAARTCNFAAQDALWPVSNGILLMVSWPEKVYNWLQLQMVPVWNGLKIFWIPTYLQWFKQVSWTCCCITSELPLCSALSRTGPIHASEQPCPYMWPLVQISSGTWVVKVKRTELMLQSFHFKPIGIYVERGWTRSKASWH